MSDDVTADDGPTPSGDGRGPHAAGGGPATDTSARQPATSELTAIGTIGNWLGSIRPGPPDADARAAVDELVPEGPQLPTYVSRFVALTALSASIAAFGLLANSGAVVIGAMLVAPLMTPIMGAAAATVTAQNRRLVRALAIIVLGTAVAILVGWIVGFVAARSVLDVRELPEEIRSRTFPGLLDLGIAITAGAAGGYIQPRRSAIAALPGVGIAVALVPPLATVGIVAELGLGDEAGNAFLLFVTNLAAIVFSAGVALILAGFRPREEIGRRALRIRLTATLTAVALVAIPLFFHTRSVVQDQRLQSAVVRAVEDWDAEVSIVENDSDDTNDRALVELLVVGRGEPEPAWQLAELIRERYGRPVELRLRYQSDQLFLVSAR